MQKDEISDVVKAAKKFVEAHRAGANTHSELVALEEAVDNYTAVMDDDRDNYLNDWGYYDIGHDFGDE